MSVLQGLGVLAVVLAALLFGRARGLGEGEARALAFATLVVGNLALVLSNRSWSRGLVATLREPNRIMGLLFVATMAVLALTLYVPFLSRLFRFQGLNAADFAGAGIGGAFCLLWCELLKALRSKAVPNG